MKLWYAGAEIPSHRKLLTNAGITTVSLSYMGLRRRVKFARPWLISEHFQDDQEVFLDSGAFSLNRKLRQTSEDSGSAEDSGPGEEDVFEIAAQYMAFVQQNIDRVTMVSEFDAMALGEDWIRGMREDFWNDLPDDKFMPVWHSETGPAELERLASRYDRVGVLQSGLGTGSVPMLNGLIARYGVKLHGVSMTQMDLMRSVRWDSVGSLSWLSPMITGGDTIIWTGHELKRYPKRYKDQSRKRHRSWIEQSGFDPVKIADDDTDEVLRLSLWSWERFVEDINKKNTLGHAVLSTFGDGGAATPPAGEDTGNPELEDPGVDTPPPGTVNGDLVPLDLSRGPQRRERTLLPLLGITYRDPPKDGSEGPGEATFEVSSRTLMACDTCFMKDKCPQATPGAECAYEFPADVRTVPQRRNVFDGLLGLQWQRVQRMSMVEQLEGGYADANLSAEMDRLARMLKIREDTGKSGFSVHVEASTSGELGAISRIFGREANETINALPAPQQVSEIATEMGMDITDAEIVE